MCFRFLCVHCHDSCETARARIRPRLDDYLYLYRTDDRRRATDKSTRQRLQSLQPVARRLSPPSAATKSTRDGALGRGRTEAPARGLAGAYTGERRAPLLDALERRSAGARPTQHARLHVVHRAPRSRAALAASPAAPHRLAPSCVARRVTHLARPAACGAAGARGRCLSELAREATHTPTRSTRTAHVHGYWTRSDARAAAG